MNLKITRALLNEYRDMRKKRTIPILELELEEMKQEITDWEIALYLIIGQARHDLRALLDLTGNCMNGAWKLWRARRLNQRRWNSG